MTALPRAAWAVAAALTFQLAWTAGAAFGAATAPELDKEAFDSLAQLLGPEWRKEIKAGPFNITVGPDEDGHFGAVLNGAGATPVDWLNSKPPTPEEFASEKSRLMSYGLVEFSADASWSSDAAALNQTSLSLKLQTTLSFLDGGKWKTEIKRFKDRERCEALAAEIDARIRNVPEAERPPAGKKHGLDLASLPELLGEFQSAMGSDCNTLGSARPPRQEIALGLYPDLRYRFGKFEVDGTQYEANQFILGGGARLFFPGLVAKYRLFREAPRLSVGYYTVLQSEDSTVPIPEDVEADYIVAQGRLLIRVPYPGYSTSTSPVHLDIEASASKPTTGADRDWQGLWKAQLSLDTKGEFKPAITYRSGDEAGLQYDKQIIFGFLWSMLNDRS